MKGLFTQPHDRFFMFSSQSPNRISYLTQLNIWLAYVSYGVVFSAEKR